MAIFISVIPMFVAICLLVLVFSKVKPSRYQKLTVVSLSVFIFTSFVLSLAGANAFDDLYTSTTEMLKLVDEGEDNLGTETEIIDGQAYQKIFVQKTHTWAKVLFAIMRQASNAVLFFLAWIAINITIEGKVEIDGAEQSSV